MEGFKQDTNLATEWIEKSYAKPNENKPHLLVAGHRYKLLWTKIGGAKIWERQIGFGKAT